MAIVPPISKLSTCATDGDTMSRALVLATAWLRVKLPSIKPARVMSPVESVLSTTGVGILDSKEIVLACTPWRKPMRAPNSSSLAAVSKLTSMLRPSAATNVTPLVSEPVSIALTPVLSLIMLIALTTSERVARVLFKVVEMLALANPLMNTKPLSTEVPVMALPVITFWLTLAYTPVPAVAVKFSSITSTTPVSPVEPAEMLVLEMLPSDGL